MKDTDKEIETGEIEEKDRIECFENKHIYRSGKNENSKNPMLGWNALKNEMALGNEKCIVTRWAMDKESSKMESRSQHQAPDKQNSETTKKEMGRRNKWLPQARGNRRDEKQWNKKTTTPG